MINVLLYQILAFTIHRKIKKSPKKLSARTWNEEFELPDGSSSHQVVVITTVQLHSNKLELRFCAGSNSTRAMPEIRDGEDL